MTVSERVKELKRHSAETMARIHQARLSHQFLLGSHNKVKLRKSLAAFDRLDLAECTLLTPEVHAKHATRLSNRYASHWARVRQSALDNWAKIPHALRQSTRQPSDQQIASSHLRFLTLIDSVTVLDASAAVRAALQMKAALLQQLKSARGVWCLGAIEIEVVSLSAMRSVRDVDLNTDSEKRKLDTCEALASDLRNTLFRDESCLFLVHFHGVLSAKHEGQFEQVRSILRSNSSWSRQPRQIEIKKLSEEFRGKPKSVEQNLKHIAKYITKGGNDWYADKAYLRYKVHFNQDDDAVHDEETWIAKNWRRDRLLRQEHKEDGVTDIMSLTVEEIAQLTIAIDTLMAMTPKRDGYLISSGR